VRRALDGARHDDEFVAYFQNFTNTYAEVSVLRERYYSALIDERIRVLAIGTRPDCISPEVCELIASYKDKVDVWVELGLQTAKDRTAEIINRGYKTEVFDEAVRLLSEYSIPVVVHLIVGLPSEGIEEIKQTVEHISDMPIWGIKIHSIYVSRGTRLAEMYASGEYVPPTEEEYLQSVVYILTHISPKTVVHRLTGDCPEGQLIAPEWNKNKHSLIEKINEQMKSQGLYQGCLYSID
jgi:radical SAM protein (TIGR01212 family)